MDKEKAILVLADAIKEKSGQKIVSNKICQKALFQRSYSRIVGEPIEIAKNLRSFSNNEIIDNDDKINIEELSDIPANYLFLEKDFTRQAKYNYTPMAIIGSEQETFLRNTFYKDVDPDISSAMDALAIENFIAFYDIYNNVKERFFEVLNSYNNIEKLISDFTYKESKDNYDKGELLDDIELYLGLKTKHMTPIETLFPELVIKGKNSKQYPYLKVDGKEYLSRKYIDTFLSAIEEKYGKIINKGYEIDTKCLYCEVPPTEPKEKLKSRIFLDFIDFVFTLDYPEQNIDVNKEIITNMKHVSEIREIMINEYRSGKYFTEYFDVLGEYDQKCVVNFVADVSGAKKNREYLLNKGFLGIKQDFLSLYEKEVPEQFKSYFGSLDHPEQKHILRKLLDYNKRNDAIDGWLVNNYNELVSEVSFDG